MRGLEYANVLPKSGRRISFFADMLLCCSAALLLHAGRWVRSRSSGVCVRRMEAKQSARRGKIEDQSQLSPLSAVGWEVQ